MLDRSGADLTASQFEDQKAFVGTQMFSGSFFSNFQRLAIGHYGSTQVTVRDFGSLKRLRDVTRFVNSVKQLAGTHSSLAK
jgi:hypothetical protein